MIHYRPHPSRILRVFISITALSHLFPLLLSYADFNCGQGLCSCFCTFSQTSHPVHWLRTLRRASRGQTLRLVSPSILHQARRAFYLRTTTTAVTHSKSRAVERFHRLIHLAACSLIYNTDTINIPQPFNSQPASVSFHRSSHETFLPRQPLYWHLSNSSLHYWCSGRTRRDIPNVFGMSSTHARVVLCIPARLLLPHAVSSCGFVGVARTVTSCNYCCKSHQFNTQRETLLLWLPDHWSINQL